MVTSRRCLWSIRRIAMALACLVVVAPFVAPKASEAAVQTLTGNYMYTWADIRAADDGMPKFERTYNSIDSRIGVLGPGWTHSFNVRLAPVTDHPDDDRVFVGPTGRQDLYVANPDGTFTPSEHAQGKLERVPQPIPDAKDIYVLTQNDGTIYRFHLGGYPFRVTFPKQPGFWLSHDAQGRVTEVGGKRKYQFSYSADGSRLIAVTDGHSPQPRQITYQYDDLGRLTTATNRLGHATEYTYVGDTHHLHQIIDARGHLALSMEYDKEGRMIRQQNARSFQEGKSSTLEYMTFPDGSSQAKFVEPPSTFTPSWPTTSVDSYDQQGRIVGRRIETGPEDEPMVLSVGAGPQGTWGITGCSGGKTPVPDDGGRQVDQVTLAGRPFLSAVRQGEPYMAPLLAAIPRPEREPRQMVELLHRIAQERTVDRNGLLTGVVIASSDERYNGAWQIGYDDEDQIVSIMRNGATEQTTTYLYDEVGNLISITEPDGNRREFEYDDRDSLIRFQDESGVTWQIEYDERNQIVRITTTSADGQSTSVTEFAHDGVGRLRLVRDLSDPSAAAEFELQYDECRVVVGIWRR